MPKCGGELTTRTDGNDIYCAACGNRGTVDEYGFLHPVGEGSVIPEMVPNWVELERDALRREIARKDFALSAPCHIQYHLDPNTTAHTDVGRGTATLTHTELIYEGTAEGKPIRYAFPPELRPLEAYARITVVTILILHGVPVLRMIYDMRRFVLFWLITYCRRKDG